MPDKPLPEILMITRPLTPPWDEASKNLAYFLATQIKDFKFHILTGQYDPSLPKNITQHLIYKGSEWTTWQKTRLIFSLSKILKENPSINTVHLLFAPTPLNSRVLKAILKSFKVKIIQNLACPPKRNSRKLFFGDKIVVYSRSTAGRIKQKNSAIIPPFIDADKFRILSKKDRLELRRKWGLDRNDKVMLYPGEYSRLEALGILWKGYVKLQGTSNKEQAGENLKLFVACRIKSKIDKIKEEKFKKLVALSPLRDSVRFLGKISNPEEMYQIADLTVFPVKKMEGKFDFPFVLLESLACGTPILTSDVGALPEIWAGDEKMEKRFVFESGENRQFVAKTKSILKKEREEFSSAFSDLLNQKFGKESVLERYREIYRKV